MLTQNISARFSRYTIYKYVSQTHVWCLRDNYNQWHTGQYVYQTLSNIVSSGKDHIIMSGWRDECEPGCEICNRSNSTRSLSSRSTVSYSGRSSSDVTMRSVSSLRLVWTHLKDFIGGYFLFFLNINQTISIFCKCSTCYYKQRNWSL